MTRTTKRMTVVNDVINNKCVECGFKLERWTGNLAHFQNCSNVNCDKLYNNGKLVKIGKTQ